MSASWSFTVVEPGALERFFGHANASQREDFLDAVEWAFTDGGIDAFDVEEAMDVAAKLLTQGLQPAPEGEGAKLQSLIVSLAFTEEGDAGLAVDGPHQPEVIRVGYLELLLASARRSEPAPVLELLAAGGRALGQDTPSEVEIALLTVAEVRALASELERGQAGLSAKERDPDFEDSTLAPLRALAHEGQHLLFCHRG